MEKIILSRHGESVATAEGIENGDPDADQGLTDRGQEQARKLGNQIADDPIDLCVVSLFPRVQQTAALALSGREVTRVVDPNLDDIRYGEFEGQPKESYMNWVKAHNLTTPLPGGESRTQVAARLCSALESDHQSSRALRVGRDSRTPDRRSLTRRTESAPGAGTRRHSICHPVPPGCGGCNSRGNVFAGVSGDGLLTTRRIPPLAPTRAST